MVVLLELINGIQLGIEHIPGEEDDEFTYAVVLNLTVLRFIFMKMKTE
ncbi:hypothetical protein UFOVP249_49 [uncultured Caudovirales phage]|uniref:Uncharacterized protein n=1 Tax=uncultured Caudovirales phage TaxID=2100421 RepID=A0A6J5LFJ5_9CAUD|nr:hypothetical protein UFOVP249_49 [uncultured Caudovirales phage]